MGTLFKVPNEALAQAAAQEWNSQGETIKRHNMHMVGKEYCQEHAVKI